MIIFSLVFLPVTLIITGLAYIVIKGLTFCAKQLGEKTCFVVLFLVCAAGMIAYPPVIHRRTYSLPLSGERTQRGTEVFAPLSKIHNSPHEIHVKGRLQIASYFLNIPVFLLEFLVFVGWLGSVYFLPKKLTVLYCAAGAGLIGLSILVINGGFLPIATWVRTTSSPFGIISLSLLSGTVWWGSREVWNILSRPQRWSVGILQTLSLMALNALFLLWWAERWFEGFA